MVSVLDTGLQETRCEGSIFVSCIFHDSWTLVRIQDVFVLRNEGGGKGGRKKREWKGQKEGRLGGCHEGGKGRGGRNSVCTSLAGTWESFTCV